MPGNQQAIGDDVRLPVCALGILATVFFEHVFYQKGNNLGQSGNLFFSVGESCDSLALHDESSCGLLDMPQHAGCVANSGHRFTCGQHRLDQGDGVGVFGQIPQGAVAAGVKNGVEIANRNLAQLQCVGQCCQDSDVRL